MSRAIIGTCFSCGKKDTCKKRVNPNKGCSDWVKNKYKLGIIG